MIFSFPGTWKAALARLAGESLDSPGRAAGAVAVGVFFGIAPCWGLQLVLALLAASALKVNRLIAGAVTNISVPPMIPFIVAGSLRLGGSVLGKTPAAAAFLRTGSLQAAKSCAVQYLVGSVLLASLSALSAGGLTYAAASVRKRLSGRRSL